MLTKKSQDDTINIKKVYYAHFIPFCKFVSMRVCKKSAFFGIGSPMLVQMNTTEQAQRPCAECGSSFAENKNIFHKERKTL